MRDDLDLITGKILERNQFVTAVDVQRAAIKNIGVVSLENIEGVFNFLIDAGFIEVYSCDSKTQPIYKRFVPILKKESR